MAATLPASPIVIYPIKGGPIFGLSIAFAVLCSIAMLGRLWSRMTLRKNKLGADDYVALALAWPFVLGTDALVALCVRSGVGRQLAEVPPVNIKLTLKLLWAGYIIYNTAIALVRISASLFYRRVFAAHRNLKIAVWCNIGANIVWTIVFHVVTITTCSPVRAYWEYDLPGAVCKNSKNEQIGGAVSTLFLDVVTLLLPLPSIWNLRVPMAKKMLVLGVFVAGYGVVVFTVGRAVSIANAGTELVTNITWSFVPPLYWIVFEINSAGIAICLPSINHLAMRAKHHGFRSLFSDADYSQPDSPAVTVPRARMSAGTSQSRFTFAKGSHQSSISSAQAFTSSQNLESGVIKKTYELSVVEGS